jgi:hypothetical protein
LVHRYVYHRPLFPWMRRIFVIHHQGHHHALFPTWRYVTNGPVRRHPIRFLLPLADWLFGTMRRSLTAEEPARHGSLAEARAHPRGMSEPAREVWRPRGVTDDPLTLSCSRRRPHAWFRAG